MGGGGVAMLESEAMFTVRTMCLIYSVPPMRHLLPEGGAGDLFYPGPQVVYFGPKVNCHWETTPHCPTISGKDRWYALLDIRRSLVS